MKRTRCGHEKRDAGREEGECEREKEEKMLEGENREEGASEEEVPDIVLLRQRNMARNAAMMASLSFNQSKPLPPPSLKPPSPAELASRTTPRNGDAASAEGAAAATATATGSVRRSTRLKKGDGENTEEALWALPGTWLTCLAGKKVTGDKTVKHDYGRELNKEEGAEEMKVLQDHVDDRDDGAAGSASYAHCIHRVRTMSDAALARRVRVIEKARGAKAREKMLVFTHVLKAKGKLELHALAEAALHRLVHGLPVPADP